MKSIRGLLYGIINSPESLIIITPPFLDSALTSIALLLERYRRGFITHVTLLTLDAFEYIGDAINRYGKALLLDPPIHIREDLVESLRRNDAYILAQEECEWARFGVKAVVDDSIPLVVLETLESELSEKSRAFLEAAIAFQQLTFKEGPLFDRWALIEETGLPPLPGVHRGDLITSLRRAFSPPLPGVTGEKEVAEEIVTHIAKRRDVKYLELGIDDILEIIKSIGDLTLRHGLTGLLIDKAFLTGHKKWKDLEIDVHESLLAIEAQLALWNYTIGMLRPIIEPTSVETVEGLMDVYASILGKCIINALSGRQISAKARTLTMFDKLCSLVQYKSDERLEFEVEGGLKVRCMTGSRGEEDADITFKHGGYLMEIREGERGG